jgi:Fe2+ transport system protein FeoA
MVLRATNEEVKTDIKYTKPLSMRQCRLKLLSMGLLESIDTEMTKDKTLSIEWEYATEIKIDNPLVLMLSEKLGLDEGARIKMFEEARLL